MPSSASCSCCNSTCWGSPACSSNVLHHSWQKVPSLPQRMAREDRQWFQEKQSHAGRPLDSTVSSLSLIGGGVVHQYWSSVGHPFPPRLAGPTVDCITLIAGREEAQRVAYAPHRRMI